MSSFSFAFLLKVWPRSRELGRNAKPLASPRPVESVRSLTRPQGFRHTSQLDKHYLKTQEEGLPPAHKGQCLGSSWNPSQVKSTDIHWEPTVGKVVGNTSQFRITHSHPGSWGPASRAGSKLIPNVFFAWRINHHSESNINSRFSLSARECNSIFTADLEPGTQSVLHVLTWAGVMTCPVRSPV